MIVTPHSWVWTQSETAAELRSSERITAVEIFKSCGSACSHTSFSTVPASTFQRQSYTPDSSTHPTHPDRQSGRSVKTQARHKTLSSSQPNPHTQTACFPLAKRSPAVKGQALGLGGPAPARGSPESGIPSLCPSAARGRRWFALSSQLLALP